LICRREDVQFALNVARQAASVRDGRTPLRRPREIIPQHLEISEESLEHDSILHDLGSVHGDS